jgi:hypothetical protein
MTERAPVLSATSSIDCIWIISSYSNFSRRQDGQSWIPSVSRVRPYAKSFEV